MIETIDIIVKDNTAYIPTFAKHPDGVFILTEHIIVIPISKESIEEELRKVYVQSHPQITKEEALRVVDKKSPLLRIVGVKSWKELAKVATSYSIDFSDPITIVPNKVDVKGRWVVDNERKIYLPLDSSVETISDALIQLIHATN